MRSHANYRLWRGRLLAGLVALVAAAVVSVASGWPPSPEVHDEFSYLLAGDTFAGGRLANPTHPLWEHFESFHVLQVPAYASKYPPGTGLLLALGQILTGFPIVGIWIGFAFMCMATAWALEAWVPPRWARWGGLTCAVWFAGAHAEVGEWVRGYWPGPLAALGGALLLGAAGRARSATPSSLVMLSALGGVGLAILANTRPFEGLLVGVALTVPILRWAVRQSVRGDRRLLARAVLPATLVVVSTFALMGYYNFRVTGRITRTPYAEYESQYASSPLLWGSSRRVLKNYRNAAMQCFYVAEAGYLSTRAPVRVRLAEFWIRTERLRSAFLPLFALPLLLAVPLMIRYDRPTLPLAALASLSVALALTPFSLSPRYVAPAIPAYFVMLTMAARRLRAWRPRGRLLGRFLLRFVQAWVLLSFAGTAIGLVLVRAKRAEKWPLQRSSMAQRLEGIPGRDVVLVSYGPRHVTGFEWVYNSADVDGAPVVWARSLGWKRDSALLTYFSDRRAWRLHLANDAGPYELQPLVPSVEQGDSLAWFDGRRVQQRCAVPPGMTR
jgi:hypothetical protein